MEADDKEADKEGDVIVGIEILSIAAAVSVVLSIVIYGSLAVWSKSDPYGIRSIMMLPVGLISYLGYEFNFLVGLLLALVGVLAMPILFLIVAAHLAYFVPHVLMLPRLRWLRFIAWPLIIALPIASALPFLLGWA